MKAGGKDIAFNRFLAAGGRFDVPHRGEIALHDRQYALLCPAAETLGQKEPVLDQHFHREIQCCFQQGGCPQVIGRPTDHLRTTALLEAALDFAMEVLVEDGFFLSKCFRGGAEQSVLSIMQRNFTTVRHVKPAASRQESVESYVLATGFHGRGGWDDVDDPSVDEDAQLPEDGNGGYSPI